MGSAYCTALLAIMLWTVVKIFMVKNGLSLVLLHITSMNRITKRTNLEFAKEREMGTYKLTKH